MLQDKINKYMDFFRGIDIQNNIIIIKAQFQDKWITVKYSDDTIKVAASEKIPNEWFFYGDVKNTTIDKIFDFVEYNINLNKEIEKKKKLFNEKKDELLKLFSESPIDDLINLKFVMTKSKKRNNKKNDINEQYSEPLKKQDKKYINKSQNKETNNNDLNNNKIQENNKEIEITNDSNILKEDIIIKGKDIDDLDL